MSHLATQRLLQASASLAPADRALLNLWVNRGLDDEQLAELTGMNAEAVRARRDGIVSALSLGSACRAPCHRRLRSSQRRRQRRPSRPCLTRRPRPPARPTAGAACAR
jgi:hypothetical protein